MLKAKLDHIAIGVPDVARVAAFLAGDLGGRQHGSGPGNGFATWQWEFAGGGVIEIIVPHGPPDGFMHRFLATRGAGAHHITFKVPDLHAALDRARGLGYEPVGIDESSPAWKEAFLHPKQAQGIVIQFAEWHPELESEPYAAGVRPPFPRVPHTAPDAVCVLGLVLSARSAERALHQWQALLGGEPVRERDRLAFGWPGSPLRIAVHVRPDAPEEGPLAIELSAARRIALPEGPHPALGIPLVQVRA